MDDAAARTFAIQLWPRRDLISSLLESCGVSMSYLTHLSKAETLHHIFCADISSLHKTDDVYKHDIPQAQEEWAKAHKRAQGKSDVRAEEKLAASDLQDILPENTICALPRTFVHNAFSTGPGEPLSAFVSDFLANVMTVGQSPHVEMDENMYWCVWKVIAGGRNAQFFLRWPGADNKSYAISVVEPRGPRFKFPREPWLKVRVITAVASA